jgi:hypothetical protein
MAENAQLKAKLLEARKEMQWLRDNLVPANPPLLKELSLVSLIPKFAGNDSAISVHEFLSSIESIARLGRWTNEDKVEVTLLKLTGTRMCRIT